MKYFRLKGSIAISDNQLQADEPEVVVYNDCFESKCQNGATCRRKLIGFTCDCPPGYKGTNKTTNCFPFNPSLVSVIHVCNCWFLVQLYRAKI